MSSRLLQIPQKLINIVVDDEVFRKFGLGQQRYNAAVVGNHCLEVGIAAQDNGHLILFGILQYGQVVGVCHRFVSDGSQ